MRNENVLYLPFHVTQKPQVSFKNHSFPGSPGTVAKGRQLRDHAPWPTLHSMWYSDLNNPGEVQKSYKLTEHLMMA